MALTIPAMCWPHRLSASGGAHLRVTYDDASTQSVTLSTGSFYPDRSGASSDLWKELTDELNSDATSGGTWLWSVPVGSYAALLTVSGGAKTPVTVELLRDLEGLDLGYASDTITISGGVAAAPYRPRRWWSPDEWMTDRTLDIDVVLVSRRSRYNGRHLVQKRSVSGGVKTFEYLIPWVRGPLLWGYAADAADLYGVVPWLTQGDPNASLDRWRERYFEGADDAGATPRARFAPDRDTPTAYDDVTLFVGQDSFEGVISDLVEQPLLAHARLRAAPWVA